MDRFFVRLLWYVFFFLPVSILQVNASVQPFSIDFTVHEQKIPGRYIEFLEQDVDESVSVLKLLHDQRWEIVSDSHSLLIKNPDRVLWLRFSIKNNTNKPVKYYLEFADSHNSKLQIFHLNPFGSIDSMAAVGFDEPFSSRVYDHKNFVYNVSLEGGEAAYFYVKIKSRYQSYFGIKLVSDQHLISYFYKEYYWLGIFYGILFIMAMYNFFLFVSTREYVYVYYVLYVLSCALYTSGEDTILFQYLWPEHPWLNHVFFMIAPSLLAFTYVLYSTSFLEVVKSYQKWVVFCYVLVAISVLFLFIDTLFWYKVSIYFFVLPFVIVNVIALSLYKKGNVFTRFFILGSVFILFSLLIFMLRKLGYVYSNAYSYYIFNIAFVVEALLFSHALADKYRLIKAEKEQTQDVLIATLKEQEVIKDTINRELESKVKQRTEELEKKSLELSEKNEELELMAEQLKQMNLKLDVDNWQLKKQVVEETKSRILLHEVSLDEFKEIFPNESACYRFLEELKWSQGFVCKKCGSEAYSQGDKLFARKCRKCKYNESITNNTLFQGLKFPIEKAFYIAYRTFKDTDKITVEELSQLVSLRAATVWAFRKKVQEAKELKRKDKVKLSSWEQIIQ